MDKSTKYYKRALELYNKGEIDNSIKLCEKSLSLNLKNSAAISFKGLLVYIKGQIDEAESLWKLNKDFNKDGVSKKYIESLKEDRNRLLKYKSALGLIKEMKIQEALITLQYCSESDFNLINVNNGISTCLIYIGKYEEAYTYIVKVLAIDRRNKEALKNKKLLKEYGVFKNRDNRKLVTVLIILVFFLVSAYGIRILFNEEKFDKKVIDNSQRNSNLISFSEKDTTVKNTDNNISNENKTVGKTNNIDENQKEQFPYDDLNEYINKLQYYNIYNILQKFKNYEMSINEKALYSKAEELLKKQGIEYFYTKASDFKKEKKYEDAILEYEKCKAYSFDTYYYGNTLFFLAYCYESIGKVDTAIMYYEDYLKGDYDQEYKDDIIYELALIYRNIDVKKSKEYASIIKKEYSDSMYNNSVIDSILKLQ